MIGGVRFWRPWFRPILFYVAFVGLAVLLTRFFHFVLVEWLTVFLLPLLWLGLASLVLIGFVWAVVFWAQSFKRQLYAKRWQNAIPLMVIVGTALVTLLVPLENLWLRLNFYRQLGTRQAVIELFQTNEIYPSPTMVKLPPVYQATTMGDEVQVFRSHESLGGSVSVLFFTLRVYEGSAGFLHSETGAPLPENAVPGYDLLEQRPVKDGWYYVRIGG